MPLEPSAARERRKAGVPVPALSIVLLYAAFGGIWILVTDRLVQSWSGDPAAALFAGTLKGVLFVAVTSLLLYGLLRRQAPDRSVASGYSHRRMRVPLVLITAAVLLATAAGMVHSLKQQRRIEVARLQAIANLKTRMIADWLDAQRRDLQLLQTSPTLAESYRQWREIGSRRDFERLTERLEDHRVTLGHREALLLDARAERLWSSPASAAAAIEPALRVAALRAIAEGRPGRLGPYRTAGGRLLLDFLAPIAAGHTDPAVVVLRSDPTEHLFADLQTWPVTSASAESLLFRRDGEEVLYLSDLRHRSDAAGPLRVPLTRTDVLAVQVARGEVTPDEVVEGVDYRGVPSLGVIRKVPGSDWFLVAKLDQAEVFANAAPSLTWIAVSGLLAWMLAGAAAAMLRQQARLTLARQQAESQAEKLRALRLLDTLSEASTDSMLVKDLDGRYRFCNPAGARAFGKQPGEVLGLDDTALMPAERAAEVIGQDRRVLAEDRMLIFRERWPAPEGEGTWLTTAGPLRDAEERPVGLFRISRDITAYLRAEELALQWAQAFQHAGFGLALADCESDTFISVNPAFAHDRGYRPEELAGQPIVTVYPPELHSDLQARIRELDALGHGVFESMHQCRDGRRFPVLLDVTVIRSVEGRPRQRVAYALDISERRRAEEAIRRLNQDLRTLSECNQAMIRAQDEDELLTVICRLLIHTGGYRMAWVGYALDDPERRVRPIAVAGENPGYVEQADISWDAASERGHGPTGTAIRMRRPIVVRNIHTDPRYGPWRDFAEQCGYASSIAMPLLLDESTCIGVLNIYAAEPDRFDHDERKLLIELAGDLAYGIRTLRDRVAHRKAEEALRESERRFRQLFDIAPVPLGYVDAQGVIVALNARFEQTFGYTHAELPNLDEWWRLAYPDPEYRQQVMAAWKAFADRVEAHGDTVHPREYRITCKNGKELTMVISGSAIGENLIAAFFDITDRKEAEARLARQVDELRRWYKVTLGREGRVLQLKQEVNDLRRRLGEPLRYSVARLEGDAEPLQESDEGSADA